MNAHFLFEKFCFSPSGPIFEFERTLPCPRRLVVPADVSVWGLGSPAVAEGLLVAAEARASLARASDGERLVHDAAARGGRGCVGRFLPLTFCCFTSPGTVLRGMQKPKQNVRDFVIGANTWNMQLGLVAGALSMGKCQNFSMQFLLVPCHLNGRVCLCIFSHFIPIPSANQRVLEEQFARWFCMDFFHGWANAV